MCLTWKNRTSNSKFVKALAHLSLALDLACRLSLPASTPLLPYENTPSIQEDKACCSKAQPPSMWCWCWAWAALPVAVTGTHGYSDSSFGISLLLLLCALMRSVAPAWCLIEGWSDLEAEPEAKRANKSSIWSNSMIHKKNATYQNIIISHANTVWAFRTWYNHGWSCTLHR